MPVDASSKFYISGGHNNTPTNLWTRGCHKNLEGSLRANRSGGFREDEWVQLLKNFYTKCCNLNQLYIKLKAQ